MFFLIGFFFFFFLFCSASFSCVSLVGFFRSPSHQPFSHRREEMDVYELGDGRQASLVEILGDEKLREVFRYFLSRRWMDEALDVWGKLEQIDHRGNEEEKGRLFLELCKKHFVAGCPNPVNVESDVLQMVLGEFEAVSSSCCSSSSYSFTSPSYSFCSSEETAEDEPLPQEKKGLSKRVMSYLKSEVWLLMASSCLPAFATSEDFTDFLDGKVDSSKGAFSREKAEQFFGCKIEGPLRREELLRAIPQEKYVSILRFRSITALAIFR